MLTTHSDVPEAAEMMKKQTWLNTTPEGRKFLEQQDQKLGPLSPAAMQENRGRTNNSIAYRRRIDISGFRQS